MELDVLKARLREESAYLTARLSVSDLALNTTAATAATAPALDPLPPASAAPAASAAPSPASSPRKRARTLTAGSVPRLTAPADAPPAPARTQADRVPQLPGARSLDAPQRPPPDREAPDARTPDAESRIPRPRTKSSTLHARAGSSPLETRAPPASAPPRCAPRKQRSATSPLASRPAAARHQPPTAAPPDNPPTPPSPSPAPSRSPSTRPRRALAPDMSLPPPLPPQQAPHLMSSPYHLPPHAHAHGQHTPHAQSPHHYSPHALPPREPASVPRRVPASGSPPHGSGIPVLKTRSASPPKMSERPERPESELKELGPRPPSITLVKNEPPPFVMFPGSDGQDPAGRHAEAAGSSAAAASAHTAEQERQRRPSAGAGKARSRGAPSSTSPRSRQPSTSASPSKSPGSSRAPGLGKGQPPAQVARKVSPTTAARPRVSSGRAAGPSPPANSPAQRVPSGPRLSHDQQAAAATPPGSRLGVAAHWIPPENSYTPPKGADWDDVVLPTVAKKLGMGGGQVGAGPNGDEGDLAVEWDRDGTPIKWVRRDQRAQPGLSNDGFIANQPDGQRGRAFSPSFEPSPDNPLHQPGQPSPSPRPSAGDYELSPMRGPRPATYAQQAEIYDAYSGADAAPAAPPRPGPGSRQNSRRLDMPPPSPAPFTSFAHGAPGGVGAGAAAGAAQFGGAFPGPPSSDTTPGSSPREKWEEKGGRRAKEDEVGKGCGCIVM